MATASQIDANRRNARKSTGPRTDKGRVRAAQNARKHGLTSPPSLEAVDAYFRMILEGCDVESYAHLPDAMKQAARSLAEAEALLHRVRDIENQLVDDWIRIEKSRRAGLSPRKAADGSINLSEQKSTPEDRLESAQLGKCEALLTKLARYRSEAESRRLTALREWIEVQKTG